MSEGPSSSYVNLVPSFSSALPPSSIATWSTTTTTTSSHNNNSHQEVHDRSSTSQPHPYDDDEDDRHADERVTIHLNSGEDLSAKPYGHSVSGHHVMLQRGDGTIWKATRSHREERFYVTMGECARSSSTTSPPLPPSQHQEHHQQFLGHRYPTEETVSSAKALSPFVPKFYGMRQVKKLRCAHDLSTPSSTAGDTHNSDFPKSPDLQPVAFDAAQPHTAEELVATFQRTVQLESIHSQSDARDESAADERPGEAEEREADDESRVDVDHSNYVDLSKFDGLDPATAVVDSTNNSAGADHAKHHLANAALRRSTLLPSKAPLSGRPLDHHLPRTEDQLVNMIVLEDICHGMVHPCVLDMKMGTRQYGVGAPLTKRLSKSEKAKQSTSGSLGLRLSGFKRFDPKTGLYEAKGKRECFRFTPEKLEDALRSFLGHNASLTDKFLTLTRQLCAAFASQTAFRFFTSSVLFVYDAMRPEETARIRMVDFAYTYTKEELEEAEDEDAALPVDVSYQKGVESLICLLEHVKAASLNAIRVGAV